MRRASTGTIDRPYRPKSHRLSVTSERRFFCYLHRLRPRILEYTSMYYSAIRHRILWYSAWTTEIFGRKTRVVHAEDSRESGNGRIANKIILQTDGHGWLAHCESSLWLFRINADAHGFARADALFFYYWCPVKTAIINLLTAQTIRKIRGIRGQKTLLGYCLRF